MMKIAIASGKGGTGKTFVATNIFSVLLRNKYRAMLVDCDAEAPNSIAFFETKLIRETEVKQLVPVINTEVCTFCGKCSEYCNYNAIFILPHVKIINVIEDLCHGCGACSVACEYGAIVEKPVSLGQVALYSTSELPVLIEARMNIGAMSPVPVIKAALKQADNQADIIIMDAPPGTSCPFIQTVAEADYIILVTEPTPFGLSDLKQSEETLKTMNKPFGVIINRSGLGDDKLMEYLLREKIMLLLEIPFKKEIAKLYSKGIIVSERDTDFSEQLMTIIETIMNLYGNSSH